MIFQSSFYQTKRILLVDDCEPIRASIRGMLQQIGFEHITAVADASAALEKAELHSFDFILADFQLGDGLNGAQLFDALKKRELLKAGCCFAMLSAESMRQPVFGLSDRQPDCYIQKPFTYLTLEKRLARAMQQRLVVRKVFQALPNAPDVALAECDRVVRESPPHALYALRLKGELLLQHKQPQLAAQLFQQILQSRELSWALLGHAIAQFQLGDLDQASNMLLVLSKAEETRPEALDWLIRLALLQQQPEQALLHCQELARSLPQSVEVLQVQAVLASLCQQLDEAIRCWQKASQQHRYSVLDSAQHYLNPARMLLLKAMQSKSLKLDPLLSKAEESLQAIPKRFLTETLQPELLLVQARIALLQGKLHQANQWRAEAEQGDVRSWSVAAFIDLALVKLAMADVKQADAVMERLQRHNLAGGLTGSVDLAYCQYWQQQIPTLWKAAKGLMQQGQLDYREQSFHQALSRLWQAFLYLPGNSNLALSLWQTLASLPASNKLQAVASVLCQVLQQSQLDQAGQQRFAALHQQLLAHYKLPALSLPSASAG
ncbi:response regulator [Alkalimonas amylolytica]|uniref:Tetratricopeptide repeat-containing protein n=1 Tax=Alkalimonas amylolytica TaxID=152573 RepID=A0A1H3XA78_ALKAM|nr:response regulator [Alkalimonas amylolytica]SDZ96305.1 Tetratricopeptide repeat-containing protein [Alkalimonas amylolytica]